MSRKTGRNGSGEMCCADGNQHFKVSGIEFSLETGWNFWLSQKANSFTFCPKARLADRRY